MNSSVDTPRKSEIGKTELKTAWSPVSSRSSGSMFIWRNRSYEFFCTSMRFGIWIAVRIFEKFVLSREVLVLVSAIFVDRSYLKTNGLTCGRTTPFRSAHGIKGANLLLNFDCCAGFSEFLLNVFCFVFGYAFLNRLRSRLNQILGFLQSKAGNFANGFDDADFVSADRSENDVELGPLLDGSGRRG